MTRWTPTGIEQLRKRQRRRALEPELYRRLRRRDPDEPAEALERAETAAQVRRAVRRLPQHLQGTLALRDLAGLPYRQVAEILGVQPGCARVHRHQAVRMLAQSQALRET
jgi:RNA polymerase sigma-70 factor (ECF subfamily)